MLVAMNTASNSSAYVVDHIYPNQNLVDTQENAPVVQSMDKEEHPNSPSSVVDVPCLPPTFDQIKKTSWCIHLLQKSSFNWVSI